MEAQSAPRRSCLGAQPAFAALALALGVLFAGCGGERDFGPEASVSVLLEVPWPDLGLADPLVVDQLGEQRALVDTGLEARKRGEQDPELAEAFGEMSLLLLTYEYMDAALVCLENAETLATEDYRWPYLRGYLSGMLGRQDQAETLLQRALEMREDFVPAVVRLAEVRLDQGRNEEASTLFERALELQPETARAIAGLARVATVLGESAEAAENFERALELEPEANAVHYSLSQVYRRLGDQERMEFHLARRGDIQVPLDDPLLNRVAGLGQSETFLMTRAAQAMKNSRFDIAADAYQKVLDLDPSSLDAHRGLSFSLEELGDEAGAVRVLEEALSSESVRAESTADQRSDLYRRLGEIHVLAKADELAVEAFAKGLRESENRADLHQLRGNALARLGRFAEAVDHFDFVLKGLADEPAGWVRRGLARINLGLIDEGLADLERAVELSPNDPALKRQYADALEHVGRGQLSSARIQELAGSEGEDLPAANDQVAQLVERGRAALVAGEFAAAEFLFSQAVGLAPDSLEASMLHASALGQLERFDEAASAFRSILDRRPRDRSAWLGELTALLFAERYSEVRERLREALGVYPREASLAHTLARLLVSSPVSSDRNGTLALDLVERLRAALGPEVRQEVESELTQTYAMALAEMGRFGDAVVAQQSLSEAALEDGMAAARLRAYRQSSPWVLTQADEVIRLLGSGSGGLP